MRTLLLTLALVFLAPVAAGQSAPRIQPTTWPPGRVTEMDSDMAFQRGDDVVVAIVQRGSSAPVGRVRIDGTTYTLRRISQRDDLVLGAETRIETWRSSNRAITVELFYTWNNAMGEESDCAYGQGIVLVTRGSRATREDVAVAACPGGYIR